jgi:CheY-like chemotaxis protein
VARFVRPASQVSGKARLGLRRRRVLVVDDNVDAAESLAMLLSASGCNVRSVYEGRSAIDAVKSDPPDAILLDIGLPEMDGFEVARRVRRLPAGAQPLIIAVTGYGSELDRERAKEAGFDHHLAKPVELEDLLKLLE